MSGPWEKYKDEQPSQQGPWLKYAQQAAPSPTTPAALPPPVTYQASPGQQQAAFQAPEPGISGMLQRAEGRMENFVGGAPDAPVRDYTLSPERGALHMAQGVVQQQPLKVAKGALEAATVPSMFMGPESASVGKLGQGMEAAGAGLNTAKQTLTLGGRSGMLDQTVTKLLGKVADTAGLKPLASSTVREALPELASRFQQRASQTYKVVDQAVGGELQPVLDKLQQLSYDYKAAAAADPAQAKQIMANIIDTGIRKKELIQQAIQNGVPNAEKLIQVADKDWSQFKNLGRVGQTLKPAMNEVQQGGILNPQKFAGGVDRLNNAVTAGGTPRLVMGLGQDAANEIKTLAQKALTLEGRAQLAGKIGGYIAKGAGLGLVGGAAWDLFHGLL